MNTNHNKQLHEVKPIHIEIWSDVVCPFCYIGKAQLEAALTVFAHAQLVSVEWKSFQLAPELVTEPNKNLNAYLAERKGITLAEAETLNHHVSQMAEQVGLHFRLNDALIVNTQRAHELIHFAKSVGKQNEMKQRLLSAYFTEGLNVDDIPTLIHLAQEVGLPNNETATVLEAKTYAASVHADMEEAHSMKISGVPFFLFNRQFAISGARGSDAFLTTLQRVYETVASQQTDIEVAIGDFCAPGKPC